MNWHPFYPRHFNVDGTTSLDSPRRVDVLDVGCGYGGMLTALAPLLPESLILGMEIRVKVSAYVHKRILALRKSAQNAANESKTSDTTLTNESSELSTTTTSSNGDYQNVAVIRT